MVTHPGQFRLSELQVYNWGTFDGLHRVPVAREGFLITGPSGSGKSTLIDAVSTLLVPPGQVRFNAAAGGRSSGRTLVTYCRGAWRREHAAEVDELTQSFLRTGAVWSGVLLRYDTGVGETRTAVRLMYLSADAHRPGDIRNLFLLLPRPADLSEYEELARGGLNMAAAKKQFPEALAQQRTHAPFSSALRRELGVASTNALELLHRTQSAKTLGDLNHLMRHFVLPEPGTFRTADTAVENFTELQTAHQAVLTAREKVVVLSPVRQAHEELAELNCRQDEAAADSAGVERYVLDERLIFATAKRDAAAAEVETLTAAQDSLAAEEEAAAAKLEILNTQLHGLQDAGLITARTNVDVAERHLAQVRATAKSFRARARAINATPPQNPEEFTNFRLQVEAHCMDLTGREKELSAQRPAVYGLLSAVTEQLAEEGRELAAIREYGSSLDRSLLRARHLIGEETGIRTSELPFVADLIHMGEGEADWQPAAERALGGFARTLLVPEEHYRAVSAAIEARHLGVKLQYVRFTTELAEANPGRIRPGWLAAKITVRPGRFHRWLQSELGRRFDYECVEELQDFHAAPRAVTRRGQLKYDRHRHEKDDRSRIEDRRRWVLSGNIDDKIAELQRSIRQLKGTWEQHTRAQEELEESIDHVSGERIQAQWLLETENFALIDVDSAQRDLAELRRIRDELSDHTPELRTLRAAKEQAELSLTRYRERHGELSEELGKQQNLLAQAEESLRYLGERRQRLEPVSEAVAARLAARFARRTRRLTADNIEEHQHQVTSELAAEQQNLQRRAHRRENIAESAMTEYLRRWEERAGDLVVGQEWRPDFLRELGRLEEDDLPRFEERFRELLQDQTRQNLNRLLREIQQAAAEIRESIEAVNQALAEVEFYEGTYLMIEVRESRPAETRQFLEKLGQVVAGSLAEESLAESEARFQHLREVIDMLSVSDGTSERVRRLRLDTREHVKFLGVEISADGTRGAVYDSAEGLSGGQAQKLSSFCLAAALYYQLTGAGLAPGQQRASVVEIAGEIYPRYGTIILDEAFDRADAEFTRAAMDAFRKFGFHMILATPEKLLQTVQDYLGGVVMVDSRDRRYSFTSQLSIEETVDENA